MGARRFCEVTLCSSFEPCAAHPKRKPFATATSSTLYRDPRWRTESRAFLAANPSCVACGGEGSIVDHRIPHRGDLALFWNRANWQTMCRRDHAAKTAREIAGRHPKIKSRNFRRGIPSVPTFTRIRDGIV